MRGLLLALLLCSWASEGQQAIVPVAGEPENLGAVKARLIQYQSCQESNCYVPQLERQSDLAIGFLKQSVAAAQPRDKLALVLDIDETSLSNWSVELHDDFGYIPNDSNWCVALHCNTAIPGTLRLFHEAEKAGVAVFFITGRPEGQRADTVANLQTVGFDRWEGLALRPENHPKSQTTVEYKSGERAKIVAKGYRLILNVGDQMSDLKGDPQAEHSVKLPNPFYLIP